MILLTKCYSGDEMEGEEMDEHGAFVGLRGSADRLLGGGSVNKSDHFEGC